MPLSRRTAVAGPISRERRDDRPHDQIARPRSLISRGIDVLTAPAMKVQRNAADHEIYSGLGLPAVYQFECPILSTRADGRVRVISPSGGEKLVEADGWTTAQRSRGHTRRAA